MTTSPSSSNEQKAYRQRGFMSLLLPLISINSFQPFDDHPEPLASYRKLIFLVVLLFLLRWELSVRETKWGIMIIFPFTTSSWVAQSANNLALLLVGVSLSYARIKYTLSERLQDNQKNQLPYEERRSKVVKKQDKKNEDSFSGNIKQWKLFKLPLESVSRLFYSKIHCLKSFLILSLKCHDSWDWV